MRLMTRKIHRAFPALDHFSDAQCSLIVPAARGGIVARVLQIVIQVVIATGMGLLTYTLLLMSTLLSWGNSLEYIWLWRTYVSVLIFLVGMLGAFGLTFLIVGDCLLRFKVYLLLRRFAACLSCNYSLVGLRVIESAIVCPECGLENDVTQAGGEIVIGTDGLERYMPNPARMQRRRERAIRRWRAVRRSAIVLVVLVALLATSFELFLHWQAEKAQQSTIDTALQFTTLARGMHGGVTLLPSEDAAPLLTRALEIYGRAKVGALPEQENSANWNEWQECEHYQGRFLEEGRFAEPASLRLHEPSQSRGIVVMVDRFRNAGFFTHLDALTNCKGIECDPIALTRSWVAQKWGRLGDINLIRMHTALATNDHPEFLRAFESNLALARLLRSLPTGLTNMIGTNTLRKTLALGIIAVRMRPKSDWIDAIERAAGRQAETMPDSFSLEGEEINALHYLAALFALPDNVRFGLLGSQGLGRATGNDVSFTDLWAGSFESVSAEIRQYVARVTPDLATEAYERVEVKPDMHAEIMHSEMARWFLPGVYELAFGNPIDRRLVWQRALATVIALERYWIARGAYPATLDELVPEYLPELPRDPYSGVELQYERVDPQPGEQQDFILQSAGPHIRGWNMSGPQPIDLAPWRHSLR